MPKTLVFNTGVATSEEAVMKDLENRFSAHEVDDDGQGSMEQVRELSKGLAEMLVALVPPGREQALAITKLEEAVFWANAGIARSQKA